MRYSRWLILAAIALILAFVWTTYSSRKKTLAKEAPVAPARLRDGIDGNSADWHYTQFDGDRPVYAISAANATAESSMTELEHVELKLYHKDASEFNLVHTEKAQFDPSTKSLYADGDVDITMNVKEEGPPHGRLLKIHTSGVHFDKTSGKAVTDRPATFEFDQGSGSAIGADYDPDTRELNMHTQVVLDWRGKKPDSKPMHAEAGEGIYRERESRVVLSPWSKLTRDTLRLDAAVSIVLLDQGDIKNAQLQSAHGIQDDPGRKVEFGADRLDLNFAEGMVMNEILGEHNSRLVSTTDSGKTTVTADHLDLGFLVSGKESTLDTGLATGNSVAESVPTAQPGALAADSRTLRSDTIRLKMRPGGKEIATAETGGPGTLDFLPNRPGQPKRTLKGDQIWIVYGPENRVESFRSTNVTTRTDKPALAGQPVPPVSVTTSKDIVASFDPATGDLSRVEQKGDFRYQEGDRQARAKVAILDQQKNVMTLDGGGRAWDPTGSVTADHIVMDQKTGDYTADGNVVSIREPDKKKEKSSGLLSQDDVIQAQAQKMVSVGRSPNQKIHYEGNAIAQQGANRIRADKLDLDNQHRVIEAHGNVFSELTDKGKTGDAKGASRCGAGGFTQVRSSDLVYNEDSHLALYQGGVSMVRPCLTVQSHELRAFLKDSTADSSSSLDKALADGAVKIVSTSRPGLPPRTRTSTGEHSEYYADEGKVVINGGQPLMVDSLKGNTRGKQLTWWEKDDTLHVDGDESEPAKSTLRKVKK